MPMYLLKIRCKELLKSLAFEFYALFAHKLGKIRYLIKKQQLPTQVQLGCGQIRMTGFVNVDILPNPAVDVIMDLRRKFYFSEQSLDLIFSEHVFEHFHPYELQHIFSEAKRCLKPGRKLLFSIPDLELLHRESTKKLSPIFQSYIKDLKRFGIHFKGKNARLQAFDHVVHQAGEHKFYYTFEYLKELLLKAGFRHVTHRSFNRKYDSRFRQKFSLLVEAD